MSFPPNVARAVRCMASRRMCRLSVAESLDCRAPSSLLKASTNADMTFGCDLLLTSIWGSPVFVVLSNLFGCRLILQHTNEWSVSQSAL